MVSTTVPGRANSKTARSNADKPGRVEVLHDFHNGSDIEPLQPPVPVDQRAVDQLDPGRLPLGEPVELEPVTGRLQGSDRHVHADDLLELLVLEQFPEQFALAAAEVEHPLRTARPDRRKDGPDPLLVQAQGPLQHLFGPVGRPLLVTLRFRRLLLLHQPGEGLAEEAGLELQIATGDLLSLRMVRQPAAPFRQQLLKLILADEVVLGVVEDRDQDVEVGQQVRESREFADRHGEVRALAPLGEPLVQRVPHRLDRIAQRLENGPEEPLAAPHGEDIEPASSESEVATNSGRSLHRPWRAEPKTWEIATLRNEEAT